VIGVKRRDCSVLSKPKRGAELLSEEGAIGPRRWKDCRLWIGVLDLWGRHRERRDRNTKAGEQICGLNGKGLRGGLGPARKRISQKKRGNRD